MVQAGTNNAGSSEGSSHIVAQFLGNIPLSNYEHRSSDQSQHKNSTDNVVQAVVLDKKDPNEAGSSGDRTQGTKKHSNPSSNDVRSPQALETPHTLNRDPMKGPIPASRSKTPQLRQRQVTTGAPQCLQPKFSGPQTTNHPKSDMNSPKQTTGPKPE